MTDDFMRRAKRGEEMRLERPRVWWSGGVIREGHCAPSKQLGGLLVLVGCKANLQWFQY